MRATPPVRLDCLLTGPSFLTVLSLAPGPPHDPALLDYSYPTSDHTFLLLISSCKPCRLSSFSSSFGLRAAHCTIRSAPLTHAFALSLSNGLYALFSFHHARAMLVCWQHFSTATVDRSSPLLAFTVVAVTPHKTCVSQTVPPYRLYRLPVAHRHAPAPISSQRYVFSRLSHQLRALLTRHTVQASCSRLPLAALPRAVGSRSATALSLQLWYCRVLSFLPVLLSLPLSFPAHGNVLVIAPPASLLFTVLPSSPALPPFLYAEPVVVMVIPWGVPAQVTLVAVVSATVYQWVVKAPTVVSAGLPYWLTGPHRFSVLTFEAFALPSTCFYRPGVVTFRTSCWGDHCECLNRCCVDSLPVPISCAGPLVTLPSPSSLAPAAHGCSPR